MEAIDLLNGKPMELEQAVARLRAGTWTDPSPQLLSEAGSMGPSCHPGREHRDPSQPLVTSSGLILTR